MARVPSTEAQVETDAVVLNLRNVGISQEQFFVLCRDNPELRLELSAQKELIIMTLPGGRTSARNTLITAELTVWARKRSTGLAFGPDCLFALPNGALRSPDASWILRTRWEALSAEEQENAVPICPDFVLELMSRTDRLKRLKAKMDEYMANGARLGWLIDPYSKNVYIYRTGEPVQQLENPASISGDPVLNSFVLNLAEIW
jgi:Uma2 family endonuclease